MQVCHKHFFLSWFINIRLQYLSFIQYEITSTKYYLLPFLYFKFLLAAGKIFLHSTDNEYCLSWVLNCSLLTDSSINQTLKYTQKTWLCFCWRIYDLWQTNWYFSIKNFFYIYIWQNTIWRVLDSQSQSFKLIPRHKIKTFAFTTGTINKSNFHKIVQN